MDLSPVIFHRLCCEFGPVFLTQNHIAHLVTVFICAVKFRPSYSKLNLACIFGHSGVSFTVVWNSCNTDLNSEEFYGNCSCTNVFIVFTVLLMKLMN